MRPTLLTDALENSTLRMERNTVRHNRLCGLEVAGSASVVARQNTFGGNAESINVDHHEEGGCELVGNSTGETADRPEGSEAAGHRVGALLPPMKGVGGRHEATGVAQELDATTQIPPDRKPDRPHAPAPEVGLGESVGLPPAGALLELGNASAGKAVVRVERTGGHVRWIY